MAKDGTGNDSPSSKRKKDIRSIRTEARIKESLLEMLGKARFSDITVSEVCRNAQTTRVTFYQHYDSLADVLDELLDDVIHELGDVPLEMCESCAGITASAGESRTWRGILFSVIRHKLVPHGIAR